MKITDEMLRAAEWAHMIEDTCGCTNASGERVFCDDKSLPEPDSVCHCKNGARAILEASLSAAPAVLVETPEVTDKATAWDQCVKSSQRARNKALEEAARILETYPLAKVPPQNMSWFGEIIDSIHALKSEEPTR